MAMAAGAMDPVHTLQAALAAQTNPQEQAELLTRLRESLEAHPGPIPLLTPTLLNIVLSSADSLLRRWCLDLVHFAICRSSLTLDQKTQISLKALDTLIRLIDDPQVATVKTSIQSLTGVYPLLFRHFCATRGDPTPWHALVACKTRIIEFVWAPTVNSGVRQSALKFVQRVILVQTRGVTDPRLQNKNDPNLSFCPADHPFISSANLEQEAQRLLEGLAHTLYSSKDVDLLSALINSWVNLVKQRTALLPFVITTLRSWTPAALTGLSASSIKSVEKAIRIFLVHLTRQPSTGQYAGQINEILAVQGVRMDRAAAEEKKRKAALMEARKRPTTTPSEPLDPKRVKLESSTPTVAPAAALASFDFTSLPASLITNLIVANLDAFTEAQLVSLVTTFCQSRNLNPPPSLASIANGSAVAASPQPAAPVMEERSTTPPAAPPSVKAEPVDPLQMDIDEGVIDFEPESIEAEIREPEAEENQDQALDIADIDLRLSEFKLPPTSTLRETERQTIISGAISRVWDGAKELYDMGHGIAPDSTQAGGNSAAEMWMLLLVRTITRVAKPPPELLEEEEEVDEKSAVVKEDYYMRQDKLRQILCDTIMADFPSRVRLATTWMNEEWYNDRVRVAIDPNWRPNYEIWLNQIVASYQTVLDGKDKTFARFLLDLPHIPSDVFDLLRDLCEDHTSSDRMHVGFATLRGLVMQRPSMRTEALDVLLELTTHPERLVSRAAINTVKLWVPNVQPMDTFVREFALQILRKLQLETRKASPAPAELAVAVEEEKSEQETSNMKANDEEKPAVETTEAEQESSVPLVHTPYLPERVELPAQKAQVLQHMELPFALSVKVPDFLDEIFAAYANMDRSVQEAIEDLITALIRSLGPNHGKLLTLLRQCPEGSEGLALRVLTIFTEHARPSAQLVTIFKGLVTEREMDPQFLVKFLVPIIAEMDKPDILKYLPRIVSSLNGTPEAKALVRNVFSSVVTSPPQMYGNSNTNMPRVRQSELLTPAELMVLLLHESERDIAFLKSAMEAINICFSMTDVFKSEVLAVVMQQIIDEPTLPVLFLRTVIQAVSTYKSLVGFVSTTLLSRLITKKIWMNPPLWEGFIRCAKAIAPASFNALLQLPKDQLRELVDKQPSLKAGLRDFVVKKAPNKARGAGFLDILGEPEETQGTDSMMVEE